MDGMVHSLQPDKRGIRVGFRRLDADRPIRGPSVIGCRCISSRTQRRAESEATRQPSLQGSRLSKALRIIAKRSAEMMLSPNHFRVNPSVSDEVLSHSCLSEPPRASRQRGSHRHRVRLLCTTVVAPCASGRGCTRRAMLGQGFGGQQQHVRRGFVSNLVNHHT